MSDFKQFTDAVNKRLTAMSKNELYVVGDDKDELWSTYLAAFPEGANPMFRTRTEFDCSTCRQFIKNFGNVVEIVDVEVRSIWWHLFNTMKYPYGTVASVMNDYVTSLPLTGVFRASERSYGTETTRALFDGQVEVFNHFWGKVANRHFTKEVGTARGQFDANVQVFERGLRGLRSHALNTIIELIDNNSLYRGEEHLRSVNEFKSLQRQYRHECTKGGGSEAGIPFIYANANNPAARFRNTVIGTLVQDLSEGVDLERAVASFESKVAPTNYKRPKSLITPNMVKEALKTINELGIEESLQRRFAKLSDVSVNNVLWVNNSTQNQMKDSLEGLLMNAATQTVKPSSKKDKPEEMSITQFMKDVLPSATEIELLVRNNHVNNFVSLTAGVHPDAPNIFKWNNNFAWSYGGDVTDSIKEKVKRAGGSVTGKIRVSLSWFNYDDLDVHVHEPNGNHIYYSARGNKLGGMLDVDMNACGSRSREPVENVTWNNRIQDGEYHVRVHNYTKRESNDVGFVIETESNGIVEHYRYDKAVPNQEFIEVGTMVVENGVIKEFKVAKDIQGGSASKELWGVKTEQFLPVSTLMYSPSHWDDQQIGNKHYLFMLRGCVNPDPTRGIYGEFLKGDLHQKHGKVFEVLGAKTRCEPSEDQLSGVGFSSTSGNSITARVVAGNRQRLININF